MKLKFYGADKEVTGSCHFLEVNGVKILIDCGLQQGQAVRDDNQLPFQASLIDYVFITHSHVDHSGRVPLLVKNGFHGKIFATGKTCELMRIMLEDSAHIQEMESQWRQRKRRRSGDDLEEPLYTMADAFESFEYLVPKQYGQKFEVEPGIQAEFIDAGHLLGSSSIRFTLTENGEEKTIVFSGDIGNYNQPIIRDPQYFHHADYVVMESTYGDRYHEEAEDIVTELAKVIDITLARGGNVVIPSFAVGRTQELLFHIREIKERFLVKSVPNFPVYVDSPLAMEATQIYDGDLTGYADEETVAILQSGFRPTQFPNLILCRSAEESIALNNDPKPKVIISSSGMCEAGRIRHHLKHNLWRPECSVIFVGYQANGTLGRMLVNGVDQVKLFGEEIAVKAQRYNFRGMSGHADKNGLIRWLQEYEIQPDKVFVVHGEEEIAEEFTNELRRMGYDAWAPDYQAEYDLLLNRCTDMGIPPVEQVQKVRRSGSAAYQRLQDVGERMLEVIRHNEGGTNKDLGKFADQLLSLIEKWDR
ncbi:MAG: MBL fold metallo-hydrolase RNA specificity domain-containing protein [Massiliimalia sp.]|jgi:metallo-beta-lactamase family protein